MSDFARAVVRVELGARSYPIHVGSRLLASPETYRELSRGSAVVVTDRVVGELYAERLCAALQASYAKVALIALPDGEASKTWETLQTIFDGMVQAQSDRGTVVYALGGGVIGDLAGFAAACYMRGVDFVQVPTTLLAQVDSSVGGKTGINHPSGKNLIGAFHQPLAVIADVDALDSLPQRELVAGMAEVIKYGAAVDEPFLAWIEASLPALLARDKHALVEAVSRSCRIKASIVAADEREAGRRAILNFGHTFAHAIETGTGHGTWLHGEAVGCGMAMAAKLSVRVGLLDPAHARRITALVAAAGLPMRPPDLGTEVYLDLMRRDKKVAEGALRFVVLEAPGRAFLRTIEPAAVTATIAEFCR